MSQPSSSHTAPAISGVRLRVLHRTTFHYAQPVSQSVNTLRLEPRNFADQRTVFSVIRVLPATRIRRYVDLFQNPAHYFELPDAHSRLEVESQFRVVRLPLARDSSLLEEDRPADDTDRERSWAYLQESPRVPRLPEVWRHAIDLGESRAGRHAKALAFMEWIHENFRYEAGATDVGTGLAKAFELRRGVCQDFTHVMLGLCRAAEIPARYVSGYLYNGPRDQLVGSQASHAWCECYLPGVGWVGYDPTNLMLTDERHVRTAVGRDYDDVAPIRGTYLGSPHCRLEVRVAVSREEA